MALNRIVFFVLLLLLLAGLRVEGNFPFEQVAAETARNSYTRDRLLALAFVLWRTMDQAEPVA
jgi:hypothetical protein